MSPSSSRDRSAGPAEITLCEDGPYLVRGDVRLLDQNGGSIDSRRRTIALCRCGRSQQRPFCDGTHRTTRFHAAGVREASSAAVGVDPAPLGSAVVAGTPDQTLTAVAIAHLTVRRSLAEDHHDGLHRAEPLLAAAVALLRWQIDAPDPPCGDTCAGDLGLAAARRAVGAAVRSTILLTLRDPPTADQVRSLVRDAASGLRPAASRSAPER